MPCDRIQVFCNPAWGNCAKDRNYYIYISFIC